MKRFEEWTIAYRKRRGNDLLVDDQEEKFKTIKNSWRYWCADPHLLDHDGKTYIFAELYDRVLRRGVIGCCEISDAGYTPWKVVLKMPWHLSYPHIFVYDDVIYMIPESYAGNEIAVYKAVSFPESWKKVHVLKPSCIAVDSTLFFHQGTYWLQTLQFDVATPSFNLYALKDGRMFENPHVITNDDTNIRPAGNLFYHKGRLIRPAQDCSESYGCALNFYEVKRISENDYEEKLIKKVTPLSIRSDMVMAPQGIHTYNISERYEIIDLKEYKVDLWFYIMRPVWFVWRGIKKILGRKHL